MSEPLARFENLVKTRLREHFPEFEVQFRMYHMRQPWIFKPEALVTPGPTEREDRVEYTDRLTIPLELLVDYDVAVQLNEKQSNSD